jgi:hypothetical protein
MKIDAKVQSISKLKDYFFLVPDYQREYVWKPDDEVEQFLIDIENEYSPDAKEQRNYFLGSIIIVNNDRCRGRTTAFDNYYVVFVCFPRFIKKGDIEQRSEKLFTDYRKSTL